MTLPKYNNAARFGSQRAGIGRQKRIGSLIENRNRRIEMSFDLMMLNPVVSCLTAMGTMIGIGVAFFLAGVIKTNRRLDQEMVSRARE